MQGTQIFGLLERVRILPGKVHRSVERLARYRAPYVFVSMHVCGNAKWQDLHQEGKGTIGLIKLLDLRWTSQ